MKTEPDPIELFSVWFKEAEREINDPNAMSLATSTLNGIPSIRMVLLKDFSDAGFVFYTNLRSRKGSELDANKHCALNFHWKSLKKQVRIEGVAKAVDEAVADKYFESRDYLSKIGAWASHQSEVMQTSNSLQIKIAELLFKYALGSVPRPPHWSGFTVVPKRIEFWSQGESRMHRRLLYVKNGSEWITARLYP